MSERVLLELNMDLFHAIAKNPTEFVTRLDRAIQTIRTDELDTLRLVFGAKVLATRHNSSPWPPMNPIEFPTEKD